MAAIEKHTPGDFCWGELGTTDADGAKAFYGELFGWSAQDNPMGAAGSYTIFQLGGRSTAGMYRLSEKQRAQGVPTHWLLYVAVESADGVVAKAAELGAEVIAKPFDVFDVGRMALIKDPTGAMLALWEPRKHIGVEIRDVHGTLCWSELVTRDTERALAFYTRLFGWESKTNPAGPMTYTEFKNQGRLFGGMPRMTEEWGNIPPHWMAYFQVDDCDQSAAKATGLAGTLKVPPTDIPGVGRFAVISDPQGAVFSIYSHPRPL